MNTKNLTNQELYNALVCGVATEFSYVGDTSGVYVVQNGQIRYRRGDYPTTEHVEELHAAFTGFWTSSSYRWNLL
jgi:hypothetical protein